MRSLSKNTFRGIFRSPGRFIAILMIIVLGSGFLVGLRVSQKAMLKTATEYLDEQRFYDFSIMSTLGLTDDDVEAFSQLQDTESAEGSVSFAALVSSGSTDERAVMFYSMPESINLPDLTEGRLPESADECIMDNQSVFNIGDVIYISDSNESDTLDNFAVRELTVVGLCTSPLYLNYERGSTSIGSGSVSAFCYVDKSVFDVDYFTTVYLRMKDMPEPYTDEYEDRYDLLEPSVSDLADERADIRYSSIVDDANSELNDAQSEYEDGLNTYDTERADAEKELEDAKSELDDAKQQIIDGQKEIDDGWAALEDAKTEAESKLSSSEDTLNKALVGLNDGEDEYSKSRDEYEDGLLQYNTGLSEYNDNLAKLTASKSELDAAKQQLDTQSTVFDGLLSTIRQNLLLPDGSAMFTDNDTLLAALNSGNETAVYAVNAVLSAMHAADSSAPESVSALLNSSGQLDAGKAQYEEGLAQYNEGKAQLDAAYETLEATHITLEDADKKLSAARKELDDGWSEYNDGLKKLQDGRSELNTTIADTTQKLQDAQKELDDAQKEYDDGYQDYLDAKQEADEKFADAESELQDAKDKIDDARQEVADIKYPSVFVLGRWGNVGYVCFESDTTIVKSVSSVFPLFFFLIAALICVTTITRMVEEQRAQLGILMALGYGRRAIMSKFFIYSGLATVLGCAIGITFGSWIIPKVIWQAYCIMYHFSDSVRFYFDVPLSLLTFGTYMAAMLLVTWLSCRHELNSTPANTLRPKAPKIGKRVLLEHVPFIWNHLSFMWKVSFRNIFRYKQRVFMMLLGVAGCTALMLTGFGINDSIHNVVEYQYSEITMYDAAVTFNEGLSENDEQEFKDEISGSFDDILFMHQSSVTATAGKNEKEVYLSVVNSADTGDIDTFVNFHDGNTHIAFPEMGEAILNSALSKALDVGVGDKITVRFDDEVMNLTVSGIFDNYIYNYIYVSSDTYDAQCSDTATINTALIGISDGVDGNALTAQILGLDNIVNVSLNTQMRDRIDSMMESLVYIVLLTIVCAAALAFTVIYNLTNINITERLREIATVKVLGFYDLESAKYVLQENIVLTILGAILGIPLGIALTTFVMAQIKIDLISFTPRILLPSYIYAIALTLVFSIFVDVFMYFRLNRINTAEALKAAE